ncbi:MAG: nitrogen fixation protein NifH [Candidatus Bathyarchaeota archaeon]|nr:nitrogen fixation protein NifH [Candidatus Bathyarchaeota archaeon]MDH5786771.1 nitrogen fixation protein NifH [Candidatus Bathyarchaeota archaeon]
MVDWIKLLEKSPLDWLLDEANPSVRCFTLRDVLGMEEYDSQVKDAKREIPKSTVVQKILQKQNREGYWQEPSEPYHPKYKSSYWQIMTLSQLGIDKTDKRVGKACEYIFQFQLKEGGFSSHTQLTASKEYDWLLKKGKKLSPRDEFVQSIMFEHQYSCLTGNMVAALIRMGYANDQRVAKALEWLLEIQNSDGGWLCPYWRAHVRDKHGCFHGTICPLEAFSEVPNKNLTKKMKQTIERGAEFLLMHRLFKADHHNYKVINKSWLQLSFPWFYGYNILRGLDVLTKLGYIKDERLNDAVEILFQKRQKDGTWILENAPIGRMQTNIEAKGKPSKWITLIAMRVLKRLYSTDSNAHN